MRGNAAVRRAEKAVASVERSLERFDSAAEARYEPLWAQMAFITLLAGVTWAVWLVLA
jgi:hypothetical protein